MLPNRYSLQHGWSNGNFRSQHWRLEARNEESEGWTALRTHGDGAYATGDASGMDAARSIPNGAYGVGCWPVKEQEGLGFRYLRVLMTGLDSYGTNFLCCSVLEFWGTLTDTTSA